MSTKVKEIENMQLAIKMDRRFKGNFRVMRNTHGGLDTNSSKGEAHWHLDKTMVCGSMAVLRCIADAETKDANATPEPPQLENDTHKDNFGRSILKPSYLKCSYQYKSELPSGIKLQAIEVVNAGSNKPFKGVKYITRTGSLVYRCT